MGRTRPALKFENFGHMPKCRGAPGTVLRCFGGPISVVCAANLVCRSERENYSSVAATKAEWME